MNKTKKLTGLERALKLAGSTYKLAKMLNVSQSNVMYWLNNSLPPKRAIEINKIYDVIKLDDLCPEIFIKKK